MACRFAHRFEYRGYEPDVTSYDIAAARLEPFGAGSVFNSELPYAPDRKFDLLVALEVLEHVEDDRAVLQDWLDWVSPGGHVLISVPAHPDRYGPCDELVGHYRRYSRTMLERLMVGVGLNEVKIESWGMPAGYALEWVRNYRAIRHSMAEEVGTGGSGRLHQPADGFGTFIRWVGGPLAGLQVPFRRTDVGVGYIAVGVVAAVS